MANVMKGVIKLLFGTKTDKDRKEVEPYLNKIKEIYPQVAALTNDELRNRTEALKESIRMAISADEAKVIEYKATLELSSTDIETKEKLSTEIDLMVKNIDKTIESVLLTILPKAFSIVKETARRFKENSRVEAIATDFDRDLAAAKEYVNIEGDKVFFNNSWQAGGNTVVWDMVHYDSQLFGGIVLHSGKIAEMATGEGKTLVATLPIFLNALTGKGVHVVTVNDYLARRDSEWMGPIFEFHGLSIDCIDRHQPNTAARRKAYMADITYGTNNEFGFDYLRDNMANSPEELVQRKHHYAIVDEVDSVLIDDARTPLIISGPVAKGDDQLFEEYNPHITKLYTLQKNLVTQVLANAKKLIAEGKTEEGGILLLRAYKGLPKYGPLIKFLSEQGNKMLLQKTEYAYMAENNKRMHEITDDLYFVIEEKMHSSDLTDKGVDTISAAFGDSKFFVLPELATLINAIDLEKIEEEEKEVKKSEIYAEYSIKSERIHTITQLLKAYAMFEKDVEYVVIDNKVKIVDEQTGRIMEGRRYSDGLHQAIEAKESVVVEAATQTFATVTLQNYFRMYHKLAGMTGTAETEVSEFWNIYKLDVVVIPTNRPVVRDDKDDIIYKTKREKYAAVIEEIVALVNAGRPVLVGTTSVEVSELLSKMLKMRGIDHNVLNAKQHQREAQIVQEAGRKGQVTIATNMAGRGTDIKLTQEVREAGGLAIIGTERHESRRVDRQLRGRSGRQGDPGSSQFFVSFEDNLMRLFGSDRIAKVIDRMGLKDGESIQAGMMSSAIERAQKKVEENHFGVRKHLLEYDDVMNSQREVIYARRRNALYGERLEVDINNMICDFAVTFIKENDGATLEEFNLELIRELSIGSGIENEKEFKAMNLDTLTGLLSKNIYEAYKKKEAKIASLIFPIIKSIYEEHKDDMATIGVPFTCGNRGYRIPVNIKKAYDTEGYEVFRTFIKLMILIGVDDNWKEHLREMDDLRQSVQNASYEQKDPLLIYKFESFGLFSKMLNTINKESLSLLLKSYIPISEGAPKEEVKEHKKKELDVAKLQTNRSEVAAGATERPKQQPIIAEKKVGRNELCPCGSGKKYKHCHGA